MALGRLVSILTLALLVAVAPRAAELCDVTCAAEHQHAAHGSMMSASPHTARHCAAHATLAHILASAHACGMHTHNFAAQFASATAAPPQTKVAALQAPVAVLLPAVNISALASPPATATHLAGLSTHAARSHPLTLALRI